MLLVAKPYLMLDLKPLMILLTAITTRLTSFIHIIPIQSNVFVAFALAVAVVLVGALTAPVTIMVAAFAVARIVASACSAQRIRRKNSGKKQK